MNDIKYLETYSILAHYRIGTDQIEVSEYLKQFKELHDFCVTHERKHREIQLKHGYTWRHILLDCKDRFNLFRTKELDDQLKAFRKLYRPKITVKAFVFAIAYDLSRYLQLFLLLFAVMLNAFSRKNLKEKWKRIKRALKSDWIEIIMKV